MSVCPFAGLACHIYCLAPFACAAAVSHAAMHAVHSGCPRPPAPASWAANFGNGSEVHVRATTTTTPCHVRAAFPPWRWPPSCASSPGDASRPLCVSGSAWVEWVGFDEWSATRAARCSSARASRAVLPYRRSRSAVFAMAQGVSRFEVQRVAREPELCWSGGLCCSRVPRFRASAVGRAERAGTRCGSWTRHTGASIPGFLGHSPVPARKLLCPLQAESAGWCTTAQHDAAVRLHTLCWTGGTIPGVGVDLPGGQADQHTVCAERIEARASASAAHASSRGSCSPPAVMLKVPKHPCNQVSELSSGDTQGRTCCRLMTGGSLVTRAVNASAGAPRRRDSRGHARVHAVHRPPL